MRVLYGILLNGNGHIYRSKGIIDSLAKRGIQVDVLFSGDRPYGLVESLDFNVVGSLRAPVVQSKNGRMDFAKSVASLFQAGFVKREVDLPERYDLVISDFEPFSIIYAKKHKIPSIGLSNQYDQIARKKLSILGILSKIYAPVDIPIGFSFVKTPWSLPPMLTPDIREIVPSKGDFTLVYLPWEEIDQVSSLLAQTKGHFKVYTDKCPPGRSGDVEFNSPDRESFIKDLSRCASVVANCGFGLLSEALFFGKSILAKPLTLQLEQVANSSILKRHNLARVTNCLTPELIEGLQGAGNPERKLYPDYSGALADWITQGDYGSKSRLIDEAWGDLEVQ